MLRAVANPNQFNVSLNPELKQRIQELADRYRDGSATKVGADILETYTELWAEMEADMEAHKKLLVDEQRRAVLEYAQHKRGRKRPPLDKALPPSSRRKNAR